jgi:3-hydroxyisobutyrate dehydrogenase-like beta-hydroxyacid dehydrogenase
VANASKDLGYYYTMTDELGVEMSVASAVHALYAGVEDPDMTMPDLIRLLEIRS